MNIIESDQILTWNDLNKLSYAYDHAFILECLEHKLLVEKIIRYVPKRRLVAYAKWRGKSVVVKLFFHSMQAKKHLERDVKGIKLLLKNHIPTPQIIEHTISCDRRVYVLILEKISDCKNLADLWHARKNIEEMYPLFIKMMKELATQHVFGIFQRDLHLNNFLITTETIYTLDGAAIISEEPLLPKKTSMHNLALFLSQLGVGTQDFQHKLFLHYAKLRGWLLKKNDWFELCQLIKANNSERWQQYKNKLFRECTDFKIVKNKNHIGMAKRHFLTSALVKNLNDPERFFKQDHVVLKAGHSATVIKTTIAGIEIVVKRYNIKNFSHRIRRAFRPSRAYYSWYFAHKMQLFGLNTPTPIAFIESKYFGLRGRAYYISQFVPGEDASGLFLHEQPKPDVSLNVSKISHLLLNLLNLNINHGDLKITNILINQDEQPYLIDLDGMKEHRAKINLWRAWSQDIKRFLANFTSLPELQKQFRTQLVISKRKEALNAVNSQPTTF